MTNSLVITLTVYEKRRYISQTQIAQCSWIGWKWCCCITMVSSLPRLGYYQVYRPPTHRPTEVVITTQPTRFYFKDLINEEYSFYRTRTQLGWCKTIVRSIIFLINIFIKSLFIFIKSFYLQFSSKENYFSIKEIRRI